MKARKYHGWIIVEKSAGFKDYFTVQWNVDGVCQTRPMGQGEQGVTRAVSFFEDFIVPTPAVGERAGEKVKGLGLGPIRLEPTPIGLRVFTEI